MTGYSFLKSNYAYITSVSARNQPVLLPLLLENRDHLYVGNGKDCQSFVTSLRDKFVPFVSWATRMIKETVDEDLLIFLFQSA